MRRGRSKPSNDTGRKSSCDSMPARACVCDDVEWLRLFTHQHFKSVYTADSMTVHAVSMISGPH